MGNLFWSYLCVLSLQALWIFGSCNKGYRPSALAILKYFHPPHDEYHFKDEDCTDPCKQNYTLLSKYTEEMERRQCCRLHPDCKGHKNSTYRTTDASCNNLLNPDWGMTETCHARILPHDYGDGVSYPRMSCLKKELPNARRVSNVIHKAIKPKVQKDVTLHFMEWGQVISHDVSYADTEELPDTGPGSCCDPEPVVDEHCIAVKIPDDDDFYPGHGISCLALQRTLKCLLCKGGVRQSLNNNTAYFDLSIVYGSTEKVANSVRSFRNGKLRVQRIPGVGDLPPGTQKVDRCEAFNSTLQCLYGGDVRINQNALISVMQTVLLRNHNNICKTLKKINSHWKDERLFQEARRINIAQAQMIAFDKFVTRLLGPGITNDPEYQLGVLPGKRFTNYDSTLDASITDEFSAAAHRVGHTMIPDTFLEIDPITMKNSTIHIKDYYSWPFDFYTGQCDRLALGMAIKHPKFRINTLSSEVRNYLYHLRRAKNFPDRDLAVLSIVRGREHGIPGYTYYLKHFFGFDIRSFCDLKGLIAGEIIEKMKDVYSSVHDVDLYTGFLSEYWVDGGLIGPTGAAIVVKQYRKLKFGDRYYFEHRRVASSFTPDQLNEIKSKTSLARILCETTKICKIQPDVFYPSSKSNKPVPCHKLPELNLELWRE